MENTQPLSWKLWERIEAVQAAGPSPDLFMVVTEALVDLALTVDPMNIYEGKDEGEAPTRVEIYATLLQLIEYLEAGLGRSDLSEQVAA